MKKKIIFISAFVILLIILIISIIYTNKNIILQDGIKFAITLDGNPTATFPSLNTGSYTIKVSCEDEIKGYFLPIRESTTKEYKITVKQTNKNILCDVNFKTKTNSDLLKTKVEIAGVSGTGNIVYESADNAGYRYEGQNPNNYIWFNDELWRIIGSVPTKTSSGIKNLVKIIRNESIGGLSYDGVSNYTGEWGKNTLYYLLNEYYYIPASPIRNTSKVKNATGTNYCNSFYDTNYTSKSRCDYSIIGIDNNSYYGNMIEKVYWNTGESTLEKVSTVYSAEKATQTVYNYIGLMNASDYGYATGENHNNKTLGQYKNGTYTLKNWLYSQGAEWMINPVFDNFIGIGYALKVDFFGSVEGSLACYGFGVRPVVYLKDSVYVVMGDGSITNPYILAY